MIAGLRIPVGVAVFAFLALAGLMGVFAFNAAPPAEAQASANTYLSELTVMYGSSELQLTPEFDRDKTFYEADAPGDLDSVTVKATAVNEDGADVQLPGAEGKVMLDGVTNMAVAVTSEDGNKTKVYFIRVTPYGANDLRELKIARTGGDVDLTPEFSPGIRNYKASVPNGVTAVDVTATRPGNSEAGLVPSGTDPAGNALTGLPTLTSGTPSEFTVALGTTTLIITVGDATKYTIEIEVESLSDNGNLKDLEVKYGSHNIPLSPAFSPGQTLYAATVPHSAGRSGSAVVVEGTKEDAGATDPVVGGATLGALDDGPNTVTVTVTPASGSGDDKIYTIILTRKEAEPNELTSLAISEPSSGVELMPSFRSDHPNYTVTMPATATAFTIVGERTGASVAYRATKAGKEVTISEAGAMTGLTAGTHVIKLTVSTDGQPTGKNKVYTVTLFVGDPPDVSEDATLSALTATAKGGAEVDIAQPFRASTMTYTATVENSVKEITVRARATHSKAKLMATATDGERPTAGEIDVKDFGKEGNPANEAVIPDLTVGINTITVTVTAEDTSTTEEYKLFIDRLAESDNADLESLMVTAGGARVGLMPAFDGDTVYYKAMVAPTVRSVTVNARPEHPYAKVLSGDTVSIDGMMTQAIVVVEAEDETKQGYLVVIDREPASDDASLTSLTVSVGDDETVTLSPPFQSGVTTYYGEVRNSAETVTVNAEPAAGATITSGTGSRDLTAGPNNISVVVTAQNGTTTETYTVVIRRISEASSNAYLSSLSLMNGEDMVTLTPSFAAETMAYTAMVANSVESVTVMATSAHMGATVSGDGMQSLDEGANTITVTVTAEDDSTMDYTITVTRGYAEVTRQQVLDAIRAYINSDAGALTREELLALIRRYISG